jgi:hypothetical protein
MKKPSFTLLLLLLLSLSSNAQKYAIGLKLGSSYSSATKSTIQDRSAIWGPNVGLTFDYFLKNNWSLSANIEEQRLGFQGERSWEKLPYTIGFDPYFETKEFYLTGYHSLSILFGKKMGEKLYFQPKVGFTLGKMYSSDFSANGDGINSNESEPRKYDLSANAELTGGWKFSTHFGVNANLGFQHGVIDFLPNKPFQDSKDFNKVLFLGFGFKYWFL